MVKETHYEVTMLAFSKWDWGKDGSAYCDRWPPDKKSRAWLLHL